MSIDLEQIEMLRARANVSYGEAKEVLEKCNNNVVEALIYLETQARIKPPVQDEPKANCTSRKIWKGGKNLIKKGNEIKFVIKKDETPIINVPLNVAIISTVLVTPFTIAGLLAAAVTGHKIRCVKPDGDGMAINKTFDKMETAVNSVSNQVVEAINKE